MCSEFVTPQKNVLLTTQTNLNAKKTRQVNKIRYQNLEKISSILCSQMLGACPLVALKPRPLTGKLPSLSTVILCSLFNKETKLFCKWSQPGIVNDHTHSNQRRVGCTRSLKYPLVVMLGARIDVIQAPIWLHTCCHCQTKIPRHLWLNEIKRADWTETIIKTARVCSAHFLSEKIK